MKFKIIFFLLILNINNVVYADNKSIQPLESTPILNEQLIEEIKLKHATAIELGRQEYIKNTLQEEKFTQGRWKNKSTDWKQQKANNYYNDVLINFIIGNDNGSLDKFVKRSPVFTQYLLYSAKDFPLATELEKEVSIVKTEKSIAESVKKNANLDRLIERLKAVTGHGTQQ